jgi:HD-GYP domain-containing protein (c-di-GMP phosphodiesterase class II)
MERLRYAALMHDIGKLVVPNQLLGSSGRLTGRSSNG